MQGQAVIQTMRLLWCRLDPANLELDPVCSAGIDHEDLAVEVQQGVQGRIAVRYCDLLITN